MADVNSANGLFGSVWQAVPGTFFGPIVVLTLVAVLDHKYSGIARIWGGAILSLTLAWLAKDALMSASGATLSARPLLAASLDGLVWGVSVAAGTALASGSRHIRLLSGLCVLALVHSVSE